MSQKTAHTKTARDPATKSGEDMTDLPHHTLKDVYFAENQILKTLPGLVKAAEGSALKEAITKHKTETEQQIKRLERVFAIMNQKPEGVPCEAIKGILKEGQEVVEKFGKTSVGDAGLIAACQAVEHYEIARYGTMKLWAFELGMTEVTELLNATLEEEYNADDTMTRIAEASVNPKAEGSTDKKRAST